MKKKKEERVLKSVGGYNLLELVGSGNFGSVYRAVEATSDTTVAVKSIPRVRLSSSRHRTALEREVRLLKSLTHPNIVRFHAHLMTENHHYLVMEYCGAGDLDAELKKAYRDAGGSSRVPFGIPEGSLQPLMVQLGRGIRYCHSQRDRVVHRDLKPANLLLAARPGSASGGAPELAERVLKIADFGLARPMQEAAMAATTCGSPLYMAPEVFSNPEYDTQADMWSVGVLLYQLLLGKPPFTGRSQNEIARNVRTRPVRFPPEPTISDACKDLILRLLDTNPARRATIDVFCEHPWIVAGEAVLADIEARHGGAVIADSVGGTPLPELPPQAQDQGQDQGREQGQDQGQEQGQAHRGADDLPPMRQRAVSRVPDAAMLEGLAFGGDGGGGGGGNGGEGGEREGEEGERERERGEGGGGVPTPSAQDDQAARETLVEPTTNMFRADGPLSTPSTARGGPAAAGGAEAPSVSPSAPARDSVASGHGHEAKGADTPAVHHLTSSIVHLPWRVLPGRSPPSGGGGGGGGTDIYRTALRSIAHSMDCARALAEITARIPQHFALPVTLKALAILESAISDAGMFPATDERFPAAAALREDCGSLFVALLERAEALGVGKYTASPGLNTAHTTISPSLSSTSSLPSNNNNNNNNNNSNNNSGSGSGSNNGNNGSNTNISRGPYHRRVDSAGSSNSGSADNSSQLAVTCQPESAAMEAVLRAAIDAAREGAVDEAAGDVASARNLYSAGALLLEAVMRDTSEDEARAANVRNYRDMILARLSAVGGVKVLED